MAQIFTDIVVLDNPEHSHRPRFDSAMQTGLDQAIFIDGDTLFLAPVYELFDVLAHFDVALAAAPQYLSPLAVSMGVFDLLPKVPLAVPEWNGGLIVARVDDVFRDMIKNWSELFTQCLRAGFRMDQASLRSTLVYSKLRIATLPNNYNFRALVGQGVAGQVKILHGHGELKRIGRSINSSEHMRVYTPRPEDIAFHPK